MKLLELKDIIYAGHMVTIREVDAYSRPEDHMITFSEAVEKYGNYYVWQIEANGLNWLLVTICEYL